MNWMLIVLLVYNGNSNGTTSQQVGPYASYNDCEKAYGVMESHDDKDNLRLRGHFCVPVPYDTIGHGRAQEFPPEFD